MAGDLPAIDVARSQQKHRNFEDSAAKLEPLRTRHPKMKFQLHSSYDSALSWAVCLQASFLALVYFGTYHLFPFCLIPVIAYWTITPIIILRHPRTTRLDLQMVRSGYFVYCLLAILVGSAYAAFRR